VKKTPILFFIHHIGEKEWGFTYSFPLHILARWFFSCILYVYRHTPTFTVSASTQKELIEKFLYPQKNVSVIENTFDGTIVENTQKKKSFLFYSRIKKIKRLEHALLAFASIHTQLPEYTLDVF
jgi:glycosyltransferase involved in cell wall biosynthesis